MLFSVLNNFHQMLHAINHPAHRWRIFKCAHRADPVEAKAHQGIALVFISSQSAVNLADGHSLIVLFVAMT